VLCVPPPRRACPSLTPPHFSISSIPSPQGFITNNYLLFHKEVLDRACKDKACKEFEPDFKLELFLERVDEIPGEFDKIETEYLDADHDEDLDEDGEDA
jgi:hypothetical protein